MIFSDLGRCGAKLDKVLAPARGGSGRPRRPFARAVEEAGARGKLPPLFIIDAFLYKNLQKYA